MVPLFASIVIQLNTVSSEPSVSRLFKKTIACLVARLS